MIQKIEYNYFSEPYLAREDLAQPSPHGQLLVDKANRLRCIREELYRAAAFADPVIHSYGRLSLR